MHVIWLDYDDRPGQARNHALVAWLVPMANRLARMPHLLGVCGLVDDLVELVASLRFVYDAPVSLMWLMSRRQSTTVTADTGPIYVSTPKHTLGACPCD